MSLLFKYRPLVINPELAARIGLNEAIILQQINYWLTETNSGIEQEGLQWVYNTHKEWVKQFPFWSIDTVKRTLLSLEKSGCVRVEQLAKAQRDMTNYYTIHYECDALNSDSKLPQSKGQIALMEIATCPHPLVQIAPIRRGQIALMFIQRLQRVQQRLLQRSASVRRLKVRYLIFRLSQWR